MWRVASFRPVNATSPSESWRRTASRDQPGAAQIHRGARPRFMAKPPLFPAEPLCLERLDGAYSPVEQAIREALPGSHEGVT